MIKPFCVVIFKLIMSILSIWYLLGSEMNLFFYIFISYIVKNVIEINIIIKWNSKINKFYQKIIKS